MQQTNRQEKEEAVLQIVYYTDPLCCWSWAFEPQWRRLRYELGNQISWRYCMGGLLANWDSYNDPMNAVNRPVQMGPLWFEAKHISGMPIREHIWHVDPPASSYPACIAVKCAALQSAAAEEAYLRVLREAVMLQEKNIAKQEVLLEVANNLSVDHPEVLDLPTFEKNWRSGAGRLPFQNDLQQVHYHKISRFPTLTIVNRQNNKGVMIVGYRPYPVLLQAIEQVTPNLQRKTSAEDTEMYKQFWGAATEREISELQT
jgi:predicted DsbA family dithiol-disulfide isomerase